MDPIGPSFLVSSFHVLYCVAITKPGITSHQVKVTQSLRGSYTRPTRIKSTSDEVSLKITRGSKKVANTTNLRQTGSLGAASCSGSLPDGFPYGDSPRAPKNLEDKSIPVGAPRDGTFLSPSPQSDSPGTMDKISCQSVKSNESRVMTGSAFRGQSTWIDVGYSEAWAHRYIIILSQHDILILTTDTLSLLAKSIEKVIPALTIGQYRP